MTMVPRAVFDLVPDVKMRPIAHRMCAANGTKVQLDGEATIPFDMDGRRLDTEPLISPDIEEPMLRAEWMKAHRCLWDFRGSELYIDGQAAVMLTQRKKLRCRRLYVDQQVVVRRVNKPPCLQSNDVVVDEVADWKYHRRGPIRNQDIFSTGTYGTY